jgi:diguanylate cyclase (GGDEF)-like protein
VADELRRQGLIDLERRTYIGSQGYLPSWLGIAAATGLFRSHLALTLGLAAGFVIIAVPRGILHGRFATLVATRPTTAAILYRLLLLSGAAYLGALAAAASVWSPLLPARLALTLGAVMVCSAATVALSLDPWSRYGIALVMGGPLWVVHVLHAGVDQGLVLVLGAAGYGYLLLTSRPVRDDYWDAAHAQSLLTRKAAALEQLSMTDPLTQIANRLAFDQRLDQEWARAVREGRPVSLLVLDVDHFKVLNDDYGHLVGDRCLIAMAATLKANVYRSVDLVARYGGEEFVVLLPDTTATAAERIAERLRTAVAALVQDHDGAAVHFTCSIGTATARPRRGGSSPSQALHAADQALYRAKAAGRDRVAVGETLVDS